MSTFANRAVALILRSPVHGVLSNRIQLIRYRGRRTGAEHTTPTQYVELDPGQLAILVGRPETKRWWRNFVEPAHMDVLVRGSWRATSAAACWRAEDPERIDGAIAAFRRKYGARHSPDPADPSPVLFVFCDTVADLQDHAATPERRANGDRTADQPEHGDACG